MPFVEFEYGKYFSCYGTILTTVWLCTDIFESEIILSDIFLVRDSTNL